MKKQRVKRKKKKLRLNYKRVFKALLILTGIILVIVYFCNLHIKRIKISGTKVISDKEIITWAGGVCCNPIACFKSEKTITILVNDVTIRSSVGANTSRVRIIAILIVFTNCAGSFMAATDKLTIGAVSSANINIEKNNNEINIFKKNPI